MAGCADCGFDWESTADEVTAQIGRLGPRYRAQLDRLRAERDDDGLRARPATGVWSPLEYSAHMRDVVEFYLDRFRRVVGEDRPRLTAIGFTALADSRRYNDGDPDEVLDALEASATSAARLLASFTPAEWQRVGTGSEGGERSVLVLARRLAHEGHHHLLDLQAQALHAP